MIVARYVHEDDDCSACIIIMCAFSLILVGKRSKLSGAVNFFPIFFSVAKYLQTIFNFFVCSLRVMNLLPVGTTYFNLKYSFHFFFIQSPKEGESPILLTRLCQQI